MLRGWVWWWRVCGHCPASPRGIFSGVAVQLPSRSPVPNPACFLSRSGPHGGAALAAGSGREVLGTRVLAGWALGIGGVVGQSRGPHAGASPPPVAPELHCSGAGSRAERGSFRSSGWVLGTGSPGARGRAAGTGCLFALL